MDPDEDTLNFFNNSMKHGVEKFQFTDTSELIVYQFLLSIKLKAIGRIK